MAGGVWGIDIGQCALRALHGKPGSDGKIIAESFDYVEYPKILSQPDADPDQLVRDALKQFLSRNSLRGDKVAISVSGQSGLARYINLPPVEDKQMPKLVGFEAKQQIPFALEDVVWDYQRMPAPSSDDDEEDLPENLVGIFAIKRDQVMRLIRPLIDAEVELDIIQLAPIAIYNAVTYDLYPKTEEELAELDPNDWTAVLSMGTESSDLVMTNGYKLWQRNIPIGGNHFTKQLTQELKLTFAKAEHVKRNARESSDAREIFRAMRPTFNDLVTELQRSISFFQSLDKGAEEKNITRFVAIGNPFKLPGLTQFLEKNLSQHVARFEEFNYLTGPEVLDAPAFKDNALSFPVTYGLVLQGLSEAKLKTNLVPREIIQQRLIRRKKPWAAAIAAAILLGMAFNYFFNWRAWDSVHEEFGEGGTTWKAVASQVDSVDRRSKDHHSTDSEQIDELARLDGIGAMAVGSADGRLLWLELLRAITAVLPQDPDQRPDLPLSLDEKPLKAREEIYITGIESEYFPDLSAWFTETVSARYDTMQQNRAAERQSLQQPPEVDENGNPIEPQGEPAVVEEIAPPDVSGSGWVIELTGHHFQHNDTLGEGAKYLRHNLLDALDFGDVALPGPDGSEMTFTLKELGIQAPVELKSELATVTIPDPKAMSKPQRGGQARPSIRARGPRQRDASTEGMISTLAYKFTVQFCWKQIPMRERLDNREALAAGLEDGE